MVVPIIGRLVAAVAGALLVLTAGASVIGTLMVPRPVGNWLTRWVDRIVNGAFRALNDALECKDASDYNTAAGRRIR